MPETSSSANIGGRNPRRNSRTRGPALTHHQATSSGIAHFAISLGWKLKAPTSTQRLAPLTSLPTPGR
jgi:hypothetical protein